ncbi:sugar ABC transporter substrate-binding protein [Streptomyces sp. NPDC003247]|uniref:sugar ABC transporter substrate-binding protein n=1 Tax=Streptomyces sp. NPDC003247 TaxID=3364677 RepID=UPI0036A392B1
MSLSAHSRKSLLVCLAGAGLLLSGCDARSSASDTTDGPLTLGFIENGDSYFHQCLKRSVEETAANNFAEIVTVDAHATATEELAAVKEMIAEQVDAIILQSMDVTAIKRDIAAARKAGVPIFLVQTTAVEPSKILGAVTSDMVGIGELDAQWIEKDAAGREVQVGVLSGMPDGSFRTLSDAFTNALPVNAQVVDTAYTNEETGKAQTAARSIVRNHPDLDYLFVDFEETALAVRKAVDAAGATQVEIVTVDGTDDGLAALKDGRFSALVSHSPKDAGELAVENTIALLRGRKADRMVKEPISLVTKETADRAPLYCPSDT